MERSATNRIVTIIFCILSGLFVLPVTIPALIFPAKAQANDIKAYCQSVANIAGGSYQIEETCRQEEMTAREELQKMTIPQRIKNYCEKVGSAAGGSYQIMETCVEQETNAKNRMNQ
jgi:hypothetical protein